MIIVNPIAPLISSKINKEPLLIDPQKKISQISNSIFKDLAIGVSRSKFIKPILTTAITLSLLTSLAFPPVWLIIAATISSFAIPLILQFSGKGWQQFTFELTTLVRLCRNKNYHKVFTHKENQASIFLGAMPNRLQFNREELTNKQGVTAILSVNESWEREPRGLSLPYTEKWEQLNTKYKEFKAIDHIPLDMKTLHDTADQIHAWIQKGKNIYVHCRAGVGRSAMAVFAYLVKYEKMTVDQAIHQIVSNRPSATIGKEKKRARLNEFYQDCQKI